MAKYSLGFGRFRFYGGLTIVLIGGVIIAGGVAALMTGIGIPLGAAVIAGAS